MRFIVALSLAAIAAASPMARHGMKLHQMATRQNATMLLGLAGNSTAGASGFTCASDQYSASQVKVCQQQVKPTR